MATTAKTPTRKITFLNTEVELVGPDAKNPFLNLFLLNVEMMEKEMGKGMEYINLAKTNYSLALKPDLEKKIMSVLKK